MCVTKSPESAEALIAHLSYNQEKGLYTHKSEITETDVELKAHTRKSTPNT